MSDQELMYIHCKQCIAEAGGRPYQQRLVVCYATDDPCTVFVLCKEHGPITFFNCKEPVGSAKCDMCEGETPHAH